MVDTSFSSVNTSLSTVNTRLGTLDTSANSAITRLGVMDTSFSSVNTRLGTLDTSANSAITRLGVIDTSLSTVNTRLGTLDTSANSAITRLGIMDTSFSSVNTSLSTVNTRLGTLDTSANSAITRLGVMDTSFSSVNTRLGTLDTSANSAITRLGVMDTSFSSVNTSLSTVNTRLGTLDTSANSAITRLAVVDTSFSSVNTRLGTLDTSANSAITRLGVMDTSFSSVNTRLGTLDTSVNLLAPKSSPAFTGVIQSAGDVSMNSRLFLGGDASFGGNVYVNNDMTIYGRLKVQQYTSAAIINTTTTNYQFIVAEDMSLNGRLYITGDASVNGKLFASGDVSMNKRLFVGGDASFGGNMLVNGDVSFNGRLYFPANSISASAVSGAGSSAFTTTISTTMDASFNGKASIGGNVFVGGNIYANGNAMLTASTSTITNDSWINTNLINPPPKVVFGTIQKKSTFIYIPWSYPTQMKVGFVNAFLPNLTGLYANYSINAGAPVSVISNGIGTNNISASQSNSDNSAITGIVFTNLEAPTGSPVPGLGYQSVTFPGESSARNVYVMNVPTATFSATTANNLFTAYYINNNGYNSNSTTFDIYLSSFPPSAPQNLTLSATNSGTTTTTAIGASYSFSAPAYKDKISAVLINDATSALSITNYDISYIAIGCARRYGGLITDSSHEFNFSSSTSGTSSNSGGAWTSIFSATGSNSGTINTLYPDASYVFYASAKNSVAASYGDIVSTTLNTGYLSPNVSAATAVSFTGASAYSAKKVSDDTSVNNLYVSKTLTTNTIISPIQYVATRGSGAAGQLTITANLKLNTSTVVDAGAAASLVYGGYGNLLSSGTNVTSTAGGIKLTAGNTTDSYNVSTSSPYNGFYQQASTTVALLSPATGSIYASNLPYTLSVTQAQTGNVSTAATYDFYYDDVATPAITAVNAAIRTVATPIQISGINVIAGNIELTVDTSVNNLGNYFYNNGTLVSYSTGQAENSLANVNTAKTTTLASPTGIRNNSTVIYTNPNSYQTSIPFSVTAAYNAIGTSSASGLSATSIPAILDYPSYALINSSIPATVPSISTSSTNGARVYSGVANGTTFVPSFLFDATTPYTSKLYNHSWSLVNNANTGGYDGTQELMIANGAFQTNSNTYAINYSTYLYGVGLYNSLNYSTLISSSATNYRFSTFAWAIPSGLTGNYGSLNVTINALANINSVNQVLFCSDNTTRMLLFYRIEDTTKLGTVSAVDGTSYSTNWISINEDGSTTSLVNVGGGNYRTSDGALYKAATKTVSQNGTALSTTSTVSVDSNSVLNISAGIPYALTPDQYGTGNLKIYVRIGLPVKVGPSTGPTMGAVGAYLV